VILINLLPHREAARKRRRDAFYVALGASAVVGGVIAGGVYVWYQLQINNQQSRNALLTSEIRKLDAQIKDIANLQAEIARAQEMIQSKQGHRSAAEAFFKKK